MSPFRVWRASLALVGAVSGLPKPLRARFLTADCALRLVCRSTARHCARGAFEDENLTRDCDKTNFRLNQTVKIIFPFLCEIQRIDS
jgi:hypothetical protein